MKFIDNHRYKRIAHSADVYNKLIVSIPPPSIHTRPPAGLRCQFGSYSSYGLPFFLFFSRLRHIALGAALLLYIINDKIA